MPKEISPSPLAIQNAQLRKIVTSLIDAADGLAHAANKSLDLDLAVGNDDFPDVTRLSEALDDHEAISDSASRFLGYIDQSS